MQWLFRRSMLPAASAAIALMTLMAISGCGGGGEGSSAPAPAETGQVSAVFSFEATPSQQRFAAANGEGRQGKATLTVAVSVSGVYSGDGRSFETAPVQIQIDAEIGSGAALVKDVPLGSNHLLKAAASYPTGEKETVYGLVEKVEKDKESSGAADSRASAGVRAMQAAAAEAGKGLNDLSFEQYKTFLAHADELNDGGVPYNEITARQLLDFEENASVPASVSISPSSATVVTGQTYQFSATVKDQNGLTIDNPAVVWSVTGEGTIAANGFYLAGDVGTDAVTATVGSVSALAAVIVIAACANNADCEDGDPLTINVCVTEGVSAPLCSSHVIVCSVNDDCDDGDASTFDVCSNGGTLSASCASFPAACGADADCDDPTPVCLNPGEIDAACVVCVSNADCYDGDSLTADGCIGAGTEGAACQNIACTSLECQGDQDCDDGDALTIDACNDPTTCDASCSNTAIECNDDNDCSGATPVCINGGTTDSACIACSTDENCDDADALTLDLCVNGGTASASCGNFSFTCNDDNDCGGGTPVCINGGGLASACIACSDDSDCSGDAPVCLNGGGSSSECIPCSTDADCDDGERLTLDACTDGGTSSAACSNTAIACTMASDCTGADDGDALTFLGCFNPGELGAACANLEPRLIATVDSGVGSGRVAARGASAGNRLVSVAVNSDGSMAYVADRAGALHAFDADALAFTGSSISIGADASFMLKDPNRDRVYALGVHQDTVKAIDLSTESVVSTIFLSESTAYYNHHIISGERDELLYVPFGNDEVRAIDLNSLTETQTAMPIALDYYGSPALHDSSGRLVSPTVNYGEIRIYDLSTESLVQTVTAPGAGYRIGRMAVHQGLGRAFGKINITAWAGNNVELHAFDPVAGTFLGGIFLADGNTSNTIESFEEANHIYMDANGEVAVVDADGFQALCTFAPPNGGIIDIAVDPARNRVYIVQDTSKLTVIEYQDNASATGDACTPLPCDPTNESDAACCLGEDYLSADCQP